MEHFAIIDTATGRVVQTGTCQEGMAVNQWCHDGQVAIQTDLPLESRDNYFNSNGDLIVAPPQPAPWAVFDVEAEEWLDPRDDASRAEAYRAALAEARAVAIPRAAFCNAIADLGVVSDAEAIAGARGEWPASLGSFLDYLTPAQARDVQIDWAACVTVQRMHPFVLTLGSWLGLSDAELDALFGILLA